MNRSSIASEELCLACGNCCRSFRIWFSKSEAIGNRLARLTGTGARIIDQGIWPDSQLVEFNRPCADLATDGRCGVFGEPARPSLCSEFPDNLFNSNADGTLNLQDTHARQVAALYSDYCPAVARLNLRPQDLAERSGQPTDSRLAPGGLTEPDIPEPPAPPRMTSS